MRAIVLWGAGLRGSTQRRPYAPRWAAALALAAALSIGPRPLSAASACTLDPGRAGTVDDYLGAALEARKHDDTARSLACLSRAYTVEPSAGLLHNIARLFEDLGRYREAAEAYRRLARDTTLDAALARADAERLQALTPRLEHAWLRAAVPPGVEARIDTTPLSSEEQPLPPGPAMLEVKAQDALHLTRLELVAGARTDLVLPLPESPSDAIIELSAEVRSLAIDGRALSTPLKGIARVRLEAGGHALTWTHASGAEERRAVTLAPGETWTAVSEGAGPRVLPWIGAAASVGLGVAGGVFLGLAEGDRQTIVSAARDPNGVVTGISFAEADRLDVRAGDRTTAGVALVIGASVAAAATALVWWLGNGP